MISFSKFFERSRGGSVSFNNNIKKKLINIVYINKTKTPATHKFQAFFGFWIDENNYKHKFYVYYFMYFICTIVINPVDKACARLTDCVGFIQQYTFTPFN